MASKRQKRRAAKAAKAAAIAAARQSQKPAKNQPVHCFEVYLQLVNPAKLLKKDIRQYFHQSKGFFQGILDALNFCHFETKRYLNSRDGKFDLMAIEKVEVYQWLIGTPESNGYISTKRMQVPIFKWEFEGKIKEVINHLNEKQQRKLIAAAYFLDKYRPVKHFVTIEEIGQEITDEAGEPLMNSSDLKE